MERGAGDQITVREDGGEFEQRIAKLRQQRPDWGAKKLQVCWSEKG